MQQRQNYQNENYYQSPSASQQLPSSSVLNYQSRQPKTSTSRMATNNSAMGDCRLDMHLSSSTIPLVQQQYQQQQPETPVMDNVPLLPVDTNNDGSTTINGSSANGDETIHMNIGDPIGEIRTQARGDINSDHVQQIVSVLKDNLTSTFPFALILVLKAFYDHSAGILMIVFFSASIYHANTVLVEQAALKSMRRIFPIIRVMCILISSLTLFLYLFRNEKFYNNLIFGLPIYAKWDLWTLLWVLYSTFCIVKMFAMLLKATLILLPGKSSKLISYRNRGCYFSIIECTSQFYISLLTIRPWIAFILDVNDHSILFSGVILIFYTILKSCTVYNSVVLLKRTIHESLQSLPFPYATTNDLAHIENMCPICRCEYRDPILLTCRHIFCEDCVTSWFDRNANCPLCRAKLAIRQSSFRDGFTSGYLIWY